MSNQQNHSHLVYGPLSYSPSRNRQRISLAPQQAAVSIVYFPLITEVVLTESATCSLKYRFFPYQTMSNSTDLTNIRLQVAFGIFSVFSLIIAVASIHPQNSLGAAWYRGLRYYTRRPRVPISQSDLEANDSSYDSSYGFVCEDDMDTPEMVRVSIDIPSPTLFFGNIAWPDTGS